MHSSAELRHPVAPSRYDQQGRAEEGTCCPQLVRLAEPDGGVVWVNPTTRSALRVERGGVYRVSRYHDGFDHVVVLGQLSASEEKAAFGGPGAAGTSELAWGLIRILDDATS